jgi:hypothetical protein
MEYREEPGRLSKGRVTDVPDTSVVVPGPIFKHRLDARTSTGCVRAGLRGITIERCPRTGRGEVLGAWLDRSPQQQAAAVPV